MKSLRCIGLLLPLIAVLVWGKAAAQSTPAPLPNRADTLVSSLYEQVVARHPFGIPYGADKKTFAPYLSNTLLHRFDVAEACFADWHRQNPDPNLKPPSIMIEDGLFSGSSEEAEPKGFYVDRIELEKDGSSRVYVRLTWDDPPNKPFIWYVAAIVVPENGRLVIDDVLYLKNKTGDVESSLSRDLSSECNGTHWIGRTLHPH